MPKSNSQQKPKAPELRLVAWETTRRCNLACIHCRAAARNEPYPGELTTEEGKAMLDEIASFAEPVIILTGGEPLMREDIFEIAKYGSDLGLRMVMAPNGTLLNEEAAKKLLECGIKRISISIDGATKESQDSFRNMPGAFDGAMHGIESAKKVGLPFQINSTVTKRNLDEIPKLLDMAIELGAVAHHIFLLVSTGRGKEIEKEEISAEQYEETLNWFYEKSSEVPLQLKATCAPHYYRIIRQKAKEEGRSVTRETHGLDAMTRGCLGGQSFCFVSHVGTLAPCGYLELDCGNVRKEGFKKAWFESEVFQNLREPDKLKGKCGLCEYRKVCGGCRARAYAKTDDYLEEEPFCVYQPPMSH